MAKITRKNQKIFGQNALSGQIGVFGSLSAGSPTTTTDPETIQSLSNYLGGWFSGVVGSNSPAIEDMNALNYLYAYQLAYLMQAGVPEYDANTTYYTGSFVQDSGIIYRSISDNNTGNAVSNASYWVQGVTNDTLAKMTDQTIKGNVSGSTAVPTDLTAQQVRTMIFSQPTIQRFTSGSGTYTTPANVKYIRVKMVGGGGGGGGAGSTGGSDGGAGTATSFGTSLLTANGGGGGARLASPGNPGGTVTINSPAITVVGLQGSKGFGGSVMYQGVATFPVGGAGGSSPFGGAGAPIYGNSTFNAISNTGSGGAGGSHYGALSNVSTGTGGSSGGYIDAIIVSPSATYSYSIGTGGTAGSAGSNAEPGTAGGSGVIIVEEYYL